MRPISEFFASLGLPLNNIRSSWGASNEAMVLLRAWSDRYDASTREVKVLRPPGEYLDSQGRGRGEHEGHLRSLWAGGIAGYVVMVTAKDPLAVPRTIIGYRDDVVWAIERLRADPDGTVVAVLGDLVPVQDVAAHARRHPLMPAGTPAPF
jgi:hypothetical protein